MKKIYILLVFTFLFQNNKAQHTLTAAFNPAIGDIDSQITLDTAGLFLGSSGSFQIWNYAGISTGTNAPYGYTYVPMSSVPNNSLYPSGTIATDLGFGGYHYVYSNTSSKVEWLGTAKPTPTDCVIYTDPQIQYTLPFMYGSSCSDTYSASPPWGSAGTITTTADGTGTLQLPSGTYSNILKLTFTFSSINGTNTVTTVMNQYFSALSKFPLLVVSSGTGSSPSSTVDLGKGGKINTLVATSMKESFQEKVFKVFPNPVTNGELFLTDKKNEASSVSVTNVIGQIVKTISFGNNTTDNKKIDVSELAKGIYYLRINSTEASKTQKIIID